MQLSRFEQKIEALSRYPQLPTAVVQQIAEILARSEDWHLFRINPFSFAAQHQLDVAVCIDIFIHAAKVGLFDFSWHQVCPGCGCVEYSHSSINSLPSNHLIYCTLCDMDMPCSLDDFVEVAFTLSSSVQALEIDPHRSFDDYNRYFFSHSLQKSPEVFAYVKQILMVYLKMESGEVLQYRFVAAPNQAYRALNLEFHTGLTISTTGEVGELPQVLDIDLLTTGLSPREFRLPAGEVVLHIHNRTHSRVGIGLFKGDFSDVQALSAQFPPRAHHFLTGKMLLNNQSFRELFRVQELAPHLKLGIRSLTILFTDLKGSTEMYGRAGDIVAYELVQTHFEVLTKIVRQYQGAIVKTMGDAIMATFSTPQAGLLASLDMMVEIERLNSALTARGYEIGLKVGINEGAALAVNADERLDYFGQAVNVAARVQGLAQAGEIWVTESIYQANGVAAALVRAGYRSEAQLARLKGVEEPVTVYCCRVV